MDADKVNRSCAKDQMGFRTRVHLGHYGRFEEFRFECRSCGVQGTYGSVDHARLEGMQHIGKFPADLPV